MDLWEMGNLGSKNRKNPTATRCQQSSRFFSCNSGIPLNLRIKRRTNLFWSLSIPDISNLPMKKGKASTVIDFNCILKSQHCSTFYCTLGSFKFVNITESSFPKREIFRFDLKLDMISKPHCCTIQHKTRWKSSKVAIKESCILLCNATKDQLITQVTFKKRCNSRILILLFLISFNPRHHKLQLNCSGNSSNIPQWKWWSINSKKRYNGT